MFSGITQGLYSVTKIINKKNFRTIFLDLGRGAKGVKIGSSIAINGVCLTVVNSKGGIVSFDVVSETLKKTNLGNLKISDRVNIEKSLKIGDRLDGHFVLGHVDGQGKITKKISEENNCLIWIKVPSILNYGLISKGSIAIDGISLTIVDIKKNNFSIALIPHTLATTTLGFKNNSDIVNLEIDYLGKWAKKLIKDKIK